MQALSPQRRGGEVDVESRQLIQEGSLEQGEGVVRKGLPVGWEVGTQHLEV